MPTRGLFLLELLDFSAAFSDALPASRHGWGLLFDTPTQGRRACYAVTGRAAHVLFESGGLFLLELFNLSAAFSDALRFGALEAELEAVAVHTHTDSAEAGFIHLVAGTGG